MDKGRTTEGVTREFSRIASMARDLRFRLRVRILSLSRAVKEMESLNNLASVTAQLFLFHVRIGEPLRDGPNGSDTAGVDNLP